MKRVKGAKTDGDLFPFHYVLNAALVAGASNFVLSPNASVSPRALIEADGWAHFRVRSLKFRLHPDPTAGNAVSSAAGFVGGVQDTPPATIGAISELIPSAFLSGGETIPTEWVHVPREDLAGPLPWYKAIPGAADPTEEAPGIICVAGTGTDTYALEMRGVFEFKTAVAIANTPEELRLVKELLALRLRKARDRQRDGLLQAMSPAASGADPARLTARASVSSHGLSKIGARIVGDSTV